MKLNNKGMSLVELIVSFAILALLVFSMLGTVISIKKKASDEAFSKEMTEFKDILVKDIEDMLIKQKEENGASINYAGCVNYICILTYSDNTKKYIELSAVNKTITLGDYTIVSDNDSFTNGIEYSIPNAERIVFDISNTSMKMSWAGSTRPILTIKVSYHEKNSTDELGFKIIQPFTIYENVFYAGDFNGDEVINANDTNKVPRYLVGLETFNTWQKILCDVDLDNICGKKDALIILKTSVNFISHLPYYYLPGDITADGIVDNSDAIASLDGLSAYANIACDINCDNECDSTDQTLISGYLSEEKTVSLSSTCFKSE